MLGVEVREFVPAVCIRLEVVSRVGVSVGPLS